MRTPKRLAAFARAFALFCALLLLPACSTGAATPVAAPSALAQNTAPSSSAFPPTQPAPKPHIVCTIFPLYDWTRQILGDAVHKVQLTLLVDNGVDLHSYQPSVEDVVTIASCDLFLYGGGEADAWVEDALAQAPAPGVRAINFLSALGDAAKAEEVVEGMQGPAEDGALDEHFWLSPKNAALCCSFIYEALCPLAANVAEAEPWRANLAAYTETLNALHAQFQKAVAASPTKTLLFCDRFPFRYLLDDYGLEYYAAFPGCSAETEASFETLAFLAQKLDELQSKTVLVSESADQTIAQTVIASTAAQNQQILVLNAMQSVTKAAADSGVSYLSLMQENCAVLQRALG